MTIIQAGAQRYDVDLIVFDKDGTLFDFQAMWARIFDLQIEALRDALSTAHCSPQARIARLFDDFFAAMGYTPGQGRGTRPPIDPRGPLALATYTEIQTILAHVLFRHGWGWDSATQVIASVTDTGHWPPLTELVVPLDDLAGLFGSLTAAGIRIGIATTDERKMTQDMLALAGALPFVAAMSCADDGLPLKPAPDSILAICRQAGVMPHRTMMVGDSPTDLLAAQAAGVAFRVGVASGVSSAETLSPLAHVVLSSIKELRILPAGAPC